MNIDKSRSYKTEKSLEKALEKYGFDQDRYVIVCNRQGRFTAIFPCPRDGNVLKYAYRNFFTLG